MNIEAIWYGETLGAKLGRVALLPISLVYALGAGVFRGIYHFGIKKTVHPHPKIVCIGNLVMGGSGKTPVTVYVCKVLTDLGHEVVLSCSGYGAPRSEAATLAPAGPLNATEWGDEPAELRELLPDVPMIVGRDRVLAATLCLQHYPNSVLLLDDGYQHLRLKKDVSIIIQPKIKNRFAFPAGPFRELKVFFVRPELELPSSQFNIVYSELTLDQAPKIANALCAIGRPDLFRKSLESTGITIEQFIALPDHHKLTEDFALPDPALPLIVTHKDWMKIRNRTDLENRTILVAKRSAQIVPNKEFAEWLKMKL